MGPKPMQVPTAKLMESQSHHLNFEMGPAPTSQAQTRASPQSKRRGGQARASTHIKGTGGARQQQPRHQHLDCSNRKSRLTAKRSVWRMKQYEEKTKPQPIRAPVTSTFLGGASLREATCPAQPWPATAASHPEESEPHHWSSVAPESLPNKLACPRNTSLQESSPLQTQEDSVL